MNSFIFSKSVSGFDPEVLQKFFCDSKRMYVLASRDGECWVILISQARRRIMLDMMDTNNVTDALTTRWLLKARTVTSQESRHVGRWGKSIARTRSTWAPELSVLSDKVRARGRNLEIPRVHENGTQPTVIAVLRERGNLELWVPTLKKKSKRAKIWTLVVHLKVLENWNKTKVNLEERRDNDQSRNRN